MRRKSEERRQHIMQVATATFSELGVENTTMSEIVSRIGGSKSTIYNYFPSKDELVQAVLAQAAEFRLQDAFAALDPARPLAAALQQFGRAYLAQLLAPEMLSATRIAQQDGARNGNGMRFYDAGPRTGWRIVQAYLAHHAAAGTLIAGDDTWVMAMHLKGLLHGELLERAMFGDILTASEIHGAADRAVEAFLRAYAVR
jgi:AcrR family transcriptional regulator